VNVAACNIERRDGTAKSRFEREQEPPFLRTNTRATLVFESRTYPRQRPRYIKTILEANHNALKVARGEIGGLAVEAATLINDFEGRQNPALLDIVEFDGFIWDPDRNRGH